MIDIDQLETDLQAILEPVVQKVDPSAILIIEPNNYPAPSTTYASMKLNSIARSGYTIKGKITEAGEVPVRGEYDLSWTFSGFGNLSKNIIFNLNFAITDNPIINEQITSIGLAQFNTPTLSDIPVLVSDQTWEERNQITVQFHYAYEELVDVGYIETLILDGTYLDIDESIVLSTSNTITLT